MKRMVSDVKFEKRAQDFKDLETRDDDGLKDRWTRPLWHCPLRGFTALS